MEQRTLKIGISCFPTWGGSGVVATEIGMAMARRGHKVHFICYDVPRRLDRFTENVFFHEVEVQSNPLFAFPPYALALTSKMVEVTTYEGLDVLHAHYAIPHATSAYLAKQVLGSKAPKVITTLHGTDITLVGNERSYLPITRFSITSSDGVTTPSHFLRNATYDKLNVPSAFPIEVIPNFVDIERFKPVGVAARKEFHKAIRGCCFEDKVLVHVSNFRPVKRIEDVVRVFARVREKVASHLVLVGDGPERSRIESLVRELGLQDHVCFFGKQESTEEILQHSDLFLLPSKHEGFGLAALEALSCGVPVIGSNAEGIPEVVRSGETGFLSDVGDVEEMAENCLKLLCDSALYERFSRASRSLVLDRYSQQKIIDQYEAFYLRVTAR